MKKVLVLTTLLSLSSVAMANFEGSNTQRGGFSGDGARTAPTSVAQALEAWDDTPVTLTGYITKQVDHDEFYFKDASGEIKIEVEDYAWNGQNVTPKDKITIEGKVDKNDWGKSTIDVYSIKK
ncbi:YgiW/YdeI family stress tolerance OB fold protein [Actinobacillus equuli]|uniref:YgiW/YdeI family stress tolerance OB fold protein n=1 Tax=Actinobacillus equuli TaxID=718 RepID=UPI002442915A|nr:NirD/YgiW/YdeI family stress tolerance protein [Actinobacillus equuli]WGE74638.1 NirD/YgiW/YdeI family stress tolerance protein [Actinobacillus equuli subsp. haemolyticus]WGE77599.1 NirD/YgiW/YdeI family stress tolerance protein [Actinobacillus equuli subsp. haemolyticus]